MKVWCIEDDADIRDIELYALSSMGFESKGFSDSAEFYNAIKNEIPDLIILDIMLPGEDGVSILKKLKATKNTENVPIIMATAKGSEFDKVQSLDIGADDYLVKPFGMMEMVSRVKSVLRRYHSNNKSVNDNVYTIDGLKLDDKEHIVTIDDIRIELTYKEYELLKIFMKNPRIAFSRDQLFDNIWGSDFIGETRTVDMHIKSLRQKLGKYGALIKTVRGIGYRLEDN